MTAHDRADLIVIGRGMFGSAAARHAAERGASVVAIGPTGRVGGPHRVYSSHDDAARLTRLQDRDERWAPVTARAVGGYAELATASGIDFHRPVGCLIAARPGGDGRNPDPIAFLREHDLTHESWEPGDRGWHPRWPALDLPPTHAVAYEPGPAGYIRPKALIEAQEVLTARAGGKLIDDTVVAVARSGAGFDVTTAGGGRLHAGGVVVATGAFANSLGMLPRRVDIELKTEVVILGEVTPADSAALADYPTVKYLNDGTDLDAIYMTPPLPYPDGRHYIKMGANTRLDTRPTELTELQAWFESDPDGDYLPLLEPALRSLWPAVDFVSMRTRTCIVTYTPERYPLIDEIEPGLVVATAGNGGGAKGSDAWGEMAAELALGGSSD